MLTLADMNPCGLTLISGPPASGKTTALKAIVAELKDTESFAVVDLEQEDWASASGGQFYGEIYDDMLLRDLVTRCGAGTIIINGIQQLQVLNGKILLEVLEELRVIAKARDLRIIMTLQTRRPASPVRPTSVEDSDRTASLTDGFIHLLQLEA